MLTREDTKRARKRALQYGENLLQPGGTFSPRGERRPITELRGKEQRGRISPPVPDPEPLGGVPSDRPEEEVWFP